jgi:hypothetical protein
VNHRYVVIVPAQEHWVVAENAHEAARLAGLDDVEIGWRVVVVPANWVHELTVDFVETRKVEEPQA